MENMGWKNPEVGLSQRGNPSPEGVTEFPSGAVEPWNRPGQGSLSEARGDRCAPGSLFLTPLSLDLLVSDGGNAGETRRDETGEAGRVGESTYMPPRLSEHSPPFVLDATQGIKLHGSDTLHSSC